MKNVSRRIEEREGEKTFPSALLRNLRRFARPLQIMTILAQLQLILGACEAWAQPRSYKSEIVGRFSTLQAQFIEGAPQGMRVAIMFAGEQKAGTYEEASALPVNREYLIVASAGRGFVEPGDQRETAGHKPIWTGLEELRDKLRGIRFDPATTDQRADVGDIGIFTLPTGQVTDALRMTVRIGTRLPQVGYNDEE